MKLGKIIRRRRSELQISQLALAVELGLSDESGISKIENGKKELAAKHIERLARFLDLPRTRIERQWIKEKVSKGRR